MALSPLTARATRPVLARPGWVNSARPRRHLVSVPTGPRVAAACSPRPHLVITARGRVVVALIVAALIALAVALAPFRASASKPVTVSTVTVASGQTLSEIAVRELPGVPVAEAVVLIQRHNRLPSTQVHAGQSLAIPGR